MQGRQERIFICDICMKAQGQLHPTSSSTWCYVLPCVMQPNSLSHTCENWGMDQCFGVNCQVERDRAAVRPGTEKPLRNAQSGVRKERINGLPSGLFSSAKYAFGRWRRKEAGREGGRGQSLAAENFGGSSVCRRRSWGKTQDHFAPEKYPARVRESSWSRANPPHSTGSLFQGAHPGPVANYAKHGVRDAILRNNLASDRDATDQPSLA